MNRLRGEMINMKRNAFYRVLLFVALASLWLGSPVLADSRLYLELPVDFEFSGDIDGSADSVSGFIVGWGFASHIGLGFEKISATAIDTVLDVRGDVDYTFVDVFVFLPAFGLDWQFGVGSGSVDLALADSAGNTFTTDGADAWQWFLTAGYQFGDATSIHLGFRKISADTDNLTINNAPSGQAFDVSGRTLSLGIQFIFF